MCRHTVCVWHGKTVGPDSGEHWKGLIAGPTSVLRRRCQKFPGGLRTPAPAFRLPFSHSSPPHCLFFLLLLSLLAPPPSSECRAAALLTLIPRPSLLTCLSDCVFVMQRRKTSSQQCEVNEKRARGHTNR